MKRMSLLAHPSPAARELEANLLKYKEESEKVCPLHNYLSPSAI